MYYKYLVYSINHIYIDKQLQKNTYNYIYCKKFFKCYQAMGSCSNSNISTFNEYYYEICLLDPIVWIMDIYPLKQKIKLYSSIFHTLLLFPKQQPNQTLYFNMQFGDTTKF